ncbi:hypothetical protein D3W54_14240 [Komagataeibacter medellinensis]|uniref:Transposase n=1 Tax=Komagataeibacter medellinensis TaxID=1177712 RepID=A0ABQ6VSL9_9PROT|nr:hypothetical protein D3W54_14240 [Komagataeibacter medellinensis]
MGREEDVPTVVTILSFFPASADDRGRIWALPGSCQSRQVYTVWRRASSPICPRQTYGHHAHLAHTLPLCGQKTETVQILFNRDPVKRFLIAGIFQLAAKLLGPEPWNGGSPGGRFMIVLAAMRPCTCAVRQCLIRMP